MTRVQIDLPIRYYTDFGRSELLCTAYDMDFLPGVGERISPLKNDPESGMTFEIYRRNWDEKGQVTLQLHNHIIRPERDVPLGHTSWWTHNRAWVGNEGEDLVKLLLANGWWRYGEEPEEETKSVDDRIIKMEFVQNLFPDTSLSAADIYRGTKKLLSVAEARGFLQNKGVTGEQQEVDQVLSEVRAQIVLGMASAAQVGRAVREMIEENKRRDELTEEQASAEIAAALNTIEDRIRMGLFSVEELLDIINGWPRGENKVDSEFGIRAATLMTEEHLTYGLVTVEQVVEFLREARKKKEDDG